jgi:peptide/nickel transport system ATP-binding protein
MNTTPLLAVDNMSVSFRARDESLIPVVREVSLEVGRREVVGLVGESGSGKTVTSLAAMGLLDENAVVRGRLTLGDTELLSLSRRQWEGVRGKRLAMIFQDPIGSLNPVFSVGRQVEEALEHAGEYTKAERRQKVLEYFRRVGIVHPEARYRDYPHTLSGGMSQRVAIAMALAGNPDLLIADEPTTALDVTIQAQILELLLSLRDDPGLSILLITHDLGVVAEYCDSVYVMYAGRIVERGPVRSVFAAPAHVYTKGLLASVPSTKTAGRPLQPIAGTVPGLREIPEGCPFYTRCPVRLPVCETEMPDDTVVADGHAAACHNLTVTGDAV